MARPAARADGLHEAWMLDRDMDEAARGIEEGRVGRARSGDCGVALPVTVSRSTRTAERTEPRLPLKLNQVEGVTNRVVWHV